MKVKKMFSKIILAGICVLGAVLITTGSKAVSETEIWLGLERYRASGDSYQTNFNGKERTAWKISSYGSGSSASSTADKSRTLYCVKAGPGFGSGTGDMGQASVLNNRFKYFNIGNLKNPYVFSSTYRQFLPSGENYNSLVWVLDHCYVPAKSGATQTEIDNAAAYREILMQNAYAYANIPTEEQGFITDDQIDVAQQLAIWYFTNNDDYKITDGTFSLMIKNISDANYKSLGQRYGTDIGMYMIKSAKAVFNYLVAGGIEHKDILPTSGTYVMPSISIVGTTATTEQVSNNYIAGPYAISAMGNDYDVVATFKNGNTDLLYTILDGNKQATTKTFKDLAVSGETFYLSISASQNIEGAVLSLKLVNSSTTLTYWSVNSPTINDQPIVEVERTMNSATAQIEINNVIEGKYRVQLVKVNEYNIEEKIPGAEFSVTVNGVNKTLMKSDNNTTFTTDYIDITSIDTVDSLKIVETTVPTGYTKLFDELNISVIKNKSGNKYVVNQLGYSATDGQYFVSSFSGDNETIIIKVKNRPQLSGKYRIQLVKVDENDVNHKLQGANFSLTVNGVIKSLTVGSDGATFTSGDIEITDLTNDSIKIVETQAPAGYSKLFDELEYTVMKTISGNKYVASQIGGAETQSQYAIVDIDSGTGIITIKVLNRLKIEGKYKLQIVKVNENNIVQKLPGAQFAMTLNGNNVPLTVTADGTTFKTGYIDILAEGTDTFRITETTAPEGFVKLIDELVVEVSKIKNGNKYEISGYNLSDTSHVSATWLDDDEIRILVKNKEVEKYNVQLVKVDADNVEHKLTGAIFTMTLNGANQTLTQSDDGTTFTSGDISLTSGTADVLTITETKAPEGYEKLIGNLQLRVNKKASGGVYSVDTIVLNDTENANATIEGNTIKVVIKNEKITEYDMALRKYILKINNQDVTVSRVPKISDATKTRLAAGEITTLSKTHPKNPLVVKQGDIVLYEIRVYNEGTADGYVKEITDYLPAGLTLKENSTINETYGWTNPSGDGKTIVSTKIKDELINAFDGTNVDSKYVQVECVVTAPDSLESQSLKNVAEITAHADKNGVTTVTDRDSTPDNLTSAQRSNYNPGTSTQGWGYEDDDDYEELVILPKTFDLALRKYILKINGEDVEESRVPQISNETIEKLASGEINTLSKVHPKNPLTVKHGDTVLYEIRVYNEGTMAGYVKEITDYLPAGLQLKENSTINNTYGWTNPSGDGKTIVSTKLKDELINEFDGTNVDSKYVQVECVVTAEDSTERQSLKNVAEITAHADKNGITTVTDRDSTPNNLTAEQKQDYNPGTSTQGWGYEDDDDYEELVIMPKAFDLALRKFITNINGTELVDTSDNYLREPTIDASKLNTVEGVTTAEYKHQKAPVGVKIGDIVIYTLRIYNEGDLDGYVSKVTDYLPPELEFVTDDDENFNATYGWILDSSLRKVTTAKLSKEVDEEDNLIKAFDKDTMETPAYVELKIKCRVKDNTIMNEVITNIAEITEFTDVNGNAIVDRDSAEDNVTLPTDENLSDYKGNSSNKSILTDSTYHYKGQEDDDDFEKLIIEEFDLALRKFITSVNDNKVTTRIPVFTTNKNENGNYVYEHSKEPVEVSSADIVEYTIRIFNEGNVNGYASKVKDDIPSGLEFLPDDEQNIEYRWKMLDKDGNETENVSEAKFIETDYLSKAQDTAERSNLIKAFGEGLTEPYYKDVKVNFKVIAPNSYTGIITNIAQISDDSDENGNPVIDIDSTPDNDDMKEDDIDVEHIKLSYFDLALRKFITKVDEKEITSRIPVFKVDEDGNYVYEHTKEPVDVVNGNVVTYTLRVYNEGTKSGYAEVIKDDIPEGLEFLPEHETNKAFNWKMLDEDGNVTEDVTKAVSIVTDFLSKENSKVMVGMPEDYTPEKYPYLKNESNLLKAFDPSIMKDGPDHLDVEVAFKVTEPNTSDRIIINQAQISDDADEDGNDVIDIDSTPDKWIDGEDDQDIEKIKVKYFDLALRKWVTEAIVIENGKEVVTQTGHKAEDDPEEVVKVEIKENKLNKVVVKFKYKIRVTNEGEIPGYADEISDYIPEGLKFVKADNPKWEEKDGKVVTDQLKDTLLNPGESAEVEILLTWVNNKNNLGLKVNTAEISKDRNDSNSKDIDSTPNNKIPKEDDIDDAPVILTIKTGTDFDMTYIFIATGAILIIGVGVIFIKKYVLN